jgi:hypothetical protein
MTLLFFFFDLSFSSPTVALSLSFVVVHAHLKISRSTRNQPLKEASYTTRTGRPRPRRFLSFILFSKSPRQHLSTGILIVVPWLLFFPPLCCSLFRRPESSNIHSTRRCLVPPATSTVDVDIIYLYPPLSIQSRSSSVFSSLLDNFAILSFVCRLFRKIKNESIVVGKDIDDLAS